MPSTPLQQATERAGRHLELVEALELEAEKSTDERRVMSLIHRAGEVLQDRMRDDDGALIRFRRVLKIDPNHVASLVSLGRVYYRMGRWEDLLETYKQELELSSSDHQQIALLHKMGELCEERLGRDTEGMEHYRRATEIDPTHRPTLRALARSLRKRGRWEELVETLEAEIQAVQDPTQKARLAYRIGEVQELHLKKPDRALAAYEQALSNHVNFRPAVDALSRLRVDQQAWSMLVKDLESEIAKHP